MDKSNLTGKAAGKSTVVGDTIRSAGENVGDYMETAGEYAKDLGKRAGKTSDRWVNEGGKAAEQMQKQAVKYSDTTIEYIQDHPVKATLIAAGIGFLLSKILKI